MLCVPWYPLNAHPGPPSPGDAPPVPCHQLKAHLQQHVLHGEVGGVHLHAGIHLRQAGGVRVLRQAVITFATAAAAAAVVVAFPVFTFRAVIRTFLLLVIALTL